MRHLLASLNRRLVRASLITLACAAVVGSAWAEDYSDVGRMLRAGHVGEASLKVDQLLAAKPNDPQLRFFKGVIQSEQGKPQDAINTFTKLTQDYPELPEPYNNLAVLYAGQSQFDKARAALEMAIRTNPSYATAHENLGDIYAKLASQAYSKALQLDGANAGVQPKLALIKDIFAPGTRTVRVASAKAAPVVAATPVAKTATAPVAKAVVPTVAPTAITAAAAAAMPVVPVKRPSVVAAPPLVAGANKAAAVEAEKAPTQASAAKAEVAKADDRSADEQAVEAAVRAWARAWEKKDMGAYYAAYGSDFRPAGGASRRAWEAERKARIVGKNKINVELSNIRVAFDGDKATVRFRQDYQGDALRVSSSKSLVLRKDGRNWVIVREAAGS